MTINRFERIKSNLHLSNNLDRTDDKLAKIRPLIGAFKKSLFNLVPSEMISIDKQVVPFKGKSSITTYNPKKPYKWGYKVFVASDNHAIVHDFEIYTGKISKCQGQEDIGAAGHIVLTLLQNIPCDVWQKVYIDSWFNTLQLQVVLYKQGIACLGTVRTNRLKGCTFPSDREHSKSGRGSSILKSVILDGVEINVISWLDRKPVTLLSTFASILPTKTVMRFDWKLKHDIDVSCPSAVSIYNSFMGGVDLLDSLVALYRNPIRSKKWYHRLLFNFLDLIVV
ncbi:piggyBac transposable element-derived protein 3-like [Physella acuta]|uniref:piggyBac transposable element-derived protein 3-like n=1 Tax=Physella acuta TaxID=109671 RepID=UPI0027DC0D2D|nr:piggyBac transposable element-derived protein 3-like [Physella acuta]